MRTTPPTRRSWAIAFVLFVVGVLGTVLDVGLQIPGQLATWALVLSALLLLLASLYKGL